MRKLPKCGLAASLFALHSVAVATVPNRDVVFTGRDVVSGALVERRPERIKGDVYVFLSSKCPCSASHERVLEALAKRFPEFRFTGVHSNQDEKAEDSQEHFAKAGLPFPVVRDEGARFAEKLGAFKTPHAFVFDARGEKIYEGGVDDSKSAPRARHHYLADALTALREGKRPEIRQTRVLGCEIQR
jgi:peroxiredoxin